MPAKKKAAKKKAAKKKAAKKKGFTDYQRKGKLNAGNATGSLPDFFKYVPDAGQVSDWLVDKLPKNVPKKKAAKKKAAKKKISQKRK